MEEKGTPAVRRGRVHVLDSADQRRIVSSSRSQPRRDPRADPDDEGSSSVTSRVDVVDMDRGAADILSGAANSLRRDLAKLHLQAAAVERTLEEHRRERAEALARLEKATERALELEVKLQQVEGEAHSLRRMHEATLEDLHKLRNEKEALAQALQQASASSEENQRLRGEIEKLREAREEAARAATTFEAELAEIRKRQVQQALEVSDKEAEAEALLGKLERAMAELTQVKEELAQAKEDSLRRIEEAADAREAAAKVRDEADRERHRAREQIRDLEQALAAARDAEEKLAQARTDLGVRDSQLAEARAEAARRERDIETIRKERDQQAERASLLEHDIQAARAEVERISKQLETANETVAKTESRAQIAERARASLEQTLSQLREDVFGAFARARASAPPPAADVPLPPVVIRTAPAEPAHVSLAPHEAESLPPDEVIEEPPKPPPIPPPRMPKSPPPLTLGLDEAWGEVPSSRKPNDEESMPPSKKATAPPSVEEPSQATRRPTAEEAAPDSTRPSSKPEPTRDELVLMLLDSRTAAEAAAALRERPDALRGIPPQSLVNALSTVDYDAEGPVFEIARAWEREPLCHALIKALKKEDDPKVREHGAWLLKHLAAPTAWKALADLARSEEESMGVRRWLLEALERLASTRAIGWRELGDLVTILSRHEDASLREGAIGILEILERSDEKKRVLLEVLKHDDDESVLATAVQALVTVLPMDLDPMVAERLLGHPSPRVQKSIKDFIEKARAEA